MFLTNYTSVLNFDPHPHNTNYIAFVSIKAVTFKLQNSSDQDHMLE